MRYSHLPGCSLHCLPALTPCLEAVRQIPPCEAPAVVGKQIRVTRSCRLGLQVWGSLQELLSAQPRYAGRPAGRVLAVRMLRG